MPPDPPVGSEQPVISGTPQEREELDCSAGEFTGTWPFDRTYKWARLVDGVWNDIDGAVYSAHMCTAADVEHDLHCTVTAANAAGSAEWAADPVGPVLPASGGGKRSYSLTGHGIRLHGRR